MSKPLLENRDGYSQGLPDELSRDLGLLCKKHDLHGVVLISFGKNDRVGVRSSGELQPFCDAMTRLGDAILTDIDDGRYDATVSPN